MSGGVASTRRFCANDNDSKYIQVLQSANGFTNDANSLYLTSAGKRVAEFTRIPTVPIAAPTSLKGNYNTKLSANSSNIVCVFDDRSVVCEGCNRFAIPYVAHIDGYFRVGNAQIANQRRCAVNNDNEIISIFRNAEKFEKASNGHVSLSKGSSRLL